MTTELQRRIDALNGCDGHWVLIVDGEPQRDCSYQWHQSPEEHYQRCLNNRWRDYSIGFAPSYLGYSDYGNTGLVGLSNYRVFLETDDPHDAIIKVGYGWNGDGIVVDIRYVTDEMLETIQSLEDYPLISEDDHTQLECEAVDNHWDGESIADRVRALQNEGLCIFAARHDDAPWRDGFDRLRQSILSMFNEYPTSAA